MAGPNKHLQVANGICRIKSTGSKFLLESKDQSTPFSAKLGQAVSNLSTYEGISTDQMVPAVVLWVEEGVPPTLGGPRAQVNALSSKSVKSIIRLYCRTYFDSGIPMPRNTVNPTGEDRRKIFMHFAYEAQNAELDNSAPNVGDFVNVIHPYAQGYKNKVGIYMGVLGRGLPLSEQNTIKKFKKQPLRARKKNVPERQTNAGCAVENVSRNPTSDPEINEVIKELHPEIRDKAATFFNNAQDAGYELKVNWGFRGFQLQDNLYAQGRVFRGPNDRRGTKIEGAEIATQARGGQSPHNYGLAFDIDFLDYETCVPNPVPDIQRMGASENSGFLKESKVKNIKPTSERIKQGYAELGRIGKSLGFRWGGDWCNNAGGLCDKPHFEYAGGDLTKAGRNGKEFDFGKALSKLQNGEVFVDGASGKTYISLRRNHAQEAQQRRMGSAGGGG